MRPTRDATTNYSLAASGLTGLLAYAKAMRVPTDGVLEAIGLTPGALAGPEARVSHAASNAAWAIVAERSGDPDFGLHFAERMDLDAFDVVGHLAARCATFGDGLDRVVAHSRILHDAGRVEVERHGAHVAVYPGCRGLLHDFPRHVAEFSAASVVALGRMVTGDPMMPHAVTFKHAAPARLSEHVRLFGVVPVFEKPETSVVLDARVLALRTRDAQPGVVTYLDAYARDVMAKLPAEDDLVTQVERTIVQALTRGEIDMQAVATQLGMSARTLQRRLADSETTFQVLVDGVRKRCAERYLADDRLSLHEIAFLVGFSDPSNFHRAFRRWTGTTPTAVRERAR